MDTYTIIKVVSSIVLVITTIFAGIVVIKKNPGYWLHRFFCIFFIATGLTFLTYFISHLIIENVTLTIAFLYIMHVFFNLSTVALLMTWVIIKYSEKIAIESKKLVLVSVIFGISLLGFFIWPLSVDPVAYAEGVVHSQLNLIWNLALTLFRLAVYLLVIISYAILAKRSEGDAKRKMKIFVIGMIIAMVGVVMIFLSTIGGLAGLLFTLIAVVLIIIGFLFLLRGLTL